MKIKSVLSVLCIIIAATSLFIFSCTTNVRGNDIKVNETNNTRLYITGNDGQLLDEYNMALQQMKYQELTDRRFIDAVKNVKIEENKIEENKAEENKATVRSSTMSVKEEPQYTKDELYLLSHLIQGEAGSDFITDEHQQLVGQVVVNRVKSDKYPDTLKEVIYQKGQYQCTTNGQFDKNPSKRAIKNAKLVLEGKVDCPENVIYQAEFKQGSGVYKKIETIISTTFFCYE